MSPVAINGVDKQGVAVNGVQVKQALSAANSTVNKGVYNATLLETVDADLAVANIKSGVTIFGKVGTVIPGGVETIEKYASAVIATGVTYTPAASGIFFFPMDSGSRTFQVEYYSNLGANWYNAIVSVIVTVGQAVGDGTNFRIKNTSAGDSEYTLMRHHYSTGTYERAIDESLAALTSYTPATTGFFADAKAHGALRSQINQTTGGWQIYGEAGNTLYTMLMIGDGANWRIYNSDAAFARIHVTMRAKLT